MGLYRNKSIVIEAHIWNGKNFDHISNFTQDWRGNKIAYEDSQELAEKTGVMYIKTLEGIMPANKGDYIIKGVNGEFYPCKPDIFKKTYEAVNNE